MAAARSLIFSNQTVWQLRLNAAEEYFRRQARRLIFLKALVDAALQLNVNFLFNSRVKSAIVEKGAISSVILENDLEVGCDALIIAVGGLSYPSTGSTGDGYEIASHLGHSIVDGRPALVPLIVEEHWARDLQGLFTPEYICAFSGSGRKG